MCDFFREFRWFFCCGLHGFSRRLWFPLDTFSYMIPWILDGWSATIVILCACGLFLYALRNTNSAWTWSECVATARTSSPASEWTLVKKIVCHLLVGDFLYWLYLWRLAPYKVQPQNTCTNHQPGRNKGSITACRHDQ